MFEDEPVSFKFSASLRICGDGLDLEGITRTLGLEPSHTHRKGQSRGKHSRIPWTHDIWIFDAPVDPSRPLEEHIMVLWDVLRPHIPYLRSLKSNFQLDIFCSYRSNSGTAGIEVDHRCLGLFIELEVPFGLSIIVV